jgi:hypothetical protein
VAALQAWTYQLSMSTYGKFKGVSLDHLTGEIIERMILGFHPRG